MSTRRLLLLCILLALQEPNAANARRVFAAVRGESRTVECFLSLAGNFKYFCKGSCWGGKILLKTDGESASDGAYSLSYRVGTGMRAKGGFMTVSIANLTAADAGRYTCALGNVRAALTNSDFEISLTDITTTPPMGTTLPAASPSTSTPAPPPTTTTTTTHISTSERFATFPATSSPSTGGSSLLPLMCLPALGVVLSAVFALAFRNRRKNARNSKQAAKTSGTEDVLNPEEAHSDAHL